MSTCPNCVNGVDNCGDVCTLCRGSGVPLPNSKFTSIKWSCPYCEVSGILDPVNDVELMSAMVEETHKVISPDCPRYKR